MAIAEHEKLVSSGEEFFVCSLLLPAIRDRYRDAFALLENPEVLRVEASIGQHGTVYFRKYDGQTYNDRWNESDGGGSLGTELAAEMVRLLGDFRKIDVEWLQSLIPLTSSVRQSVFNLKGWLDSFRQQKQEALRIGVPEDEFVAAEQLVSLGFNSSYLIVSNGDFYPRNLITLQEKVVVVDWGHWAGYRACFVDYLVNLASFAFIHMWGNKQWQEQFVGYLVATLDVELNDFKKAVLIKSFEQAMFWQHLPQFAAPQVNHFRMALRDDLSF